MVGKEGEISTEASRIRVMVIPTNEELLIARDTFRAVRGTTESPLASGRGWSNQKLWARK